MKSGARRIALAALASLCFTPAHAAGIHGRAAIEDAFAIEGPQSLSAMLGERTRNDVLGDLRLTWEPRAGPWSFDVAYQLSVDWGDAPTLARREAALGVFPALPPATWFDLSDTFADETHLTATHRIDRLSVGYTTEHLVLRAGRQALTWGSGFVFHPMDLFDPFAPNATDTEYKPGADMIYGQWLFDDGSDLQAVIAPRPMRKGGGLREDASSFALHYHKTLGSLQTTWLAARDHGDWTFAGGVNGSLGGATWNAEIVPTLVHGGDARTSALLNISNAVTLFGHDATLFAEYFHNGFGIARRGYAFTDLSAPLFDRLARGQVFNTGRDYLAAGGTFQATPLLTVDPTVIANLNDQSLYGLVQATLSLNDNLNLVAGAQAPVGPKRTEFGGIPLTPDGPPFVEQPSQIYAQLRQYF